METLCRWWPVLALLAACATEDGGRGLGQLGQSDTGNDADSDTDSDDPLDSISATVGDQTSTSAGPGSDPTDEEPDPSSTSDDPSTSATTDDTTTGRTPASSSSGGSQEAEATTSCDRSSALWGDCLNYGNDECNSEDASCLLDVVGNPSYGMCAVLDCDNDCDCPAAPATGTAEPRCDSIVSGGENACYLDCTGGATCPDGMECWQNQSCMWPDLVCMDPLPAGVYGDCVTSGTAACNDDEALCLVDDPDDSTTGVCAFTGCETDCDCPAAPATGDAPVVCGPIVADSEDNACHLSCSAGQTCPDGMTCFMDFICMW